jgi:nucleoside-diphosphate-sugar epimerase
VKVLVTGATGFIGSHLVSALLDKGYEVRCFVRKSSNIEHLKLQGVEIVSGDLSDPASLAAAVEGADSVFHLAAIRGETAFPYSKYWEVNVQGTKNILEAACREGIRQFIYVSTIGVIGWPKNLPADETSPCHPAGKYHVTKYEAEKLVLAAQIEKRIQTTIIRPVMTYGEAEGFLFSLAKLIKTGKFVKIGNGENHLHLVSVNNLVQGLCLALTNPNSRGNLYIIADNQPITLNKLVLILSGNLDMPAIKFHVPIWIANPAGFSLELIYDILGNNNEPLITQSKIDLVSKNRYYNISKAKRELGYNPLINTEEGLRQAVELFVKNKTL